MALSAKEREKIVEEETLRYQTRQSLHHEACAKHPRRGRWLWILAAAILAYAAWSYAFCGGARCPFMGAHGAVPMCHHGGMGMDMGQDVQPGQPIPKKP